MSRYVFLYGGMAGIAIIASITFGLAMSAGDSTHLATSEWLGYLVMIIALSLIFIGIKRYRDRELGGVIRFGQALVLGLGMSAVAAAIYVVIWEVYLAATNYAFIEQYTASVVAESAASGATAAELEVLNDEMATMKRNYANPLFRLPMTFLELFPLAALISLLSAAILRNSGVLPAAATAG